MVIAFRDPTFELSILAGQSAEFLIKVQFAGKANHALELVPQLFTTSAFIKHQLFIHLVFAGFIGFLLSIALYNFFLCLCRQ